MEHLDYELPSRPQPHRREPLLVGVVGSGNCELLLEGGPPADRCRISIKTSAHGFAPIWTAVVADFAARAAAGGLQIEINDVGATPAVVSLRLDQAIEAWEESANV
ncbi:MAG: malonate decarboxylase acyl carrier protein [Rhodocyclales bacterium]|nr:malonate decarboxylase acyl carrier protein [Rhodocyclales bacterium]